MSTPKQTSILLERYLRRAGLILLIVCLAVLLQGRIGSQIALFQFKNAQSAAAQSVPSEQASSSQKVDFSLWAKTRIQAYMSSLFSSTARPLAVLEIEKVRIKAPVFDGTDALSLNRGVGRIANTAMPGATGNVGIAGHRDGFFRGLKDISVGDEVDLVTTTEKYRYVVDQIEIVSPSNVNVLRPGTAPSLTLVTCYPFYYVGAAPQRFIVHASMSSRQPMGGSGTQSTATLEVKGKSKENRQ